MDRSISSQGDEWDLVVKVQYGDVLRRIVAHVYGNSVDHNLNDLRMKIINLFKLRSNVDFVLTYTDVDGDLVTLDSDNELCDAVIHQRLNPLRINVQSNSSSIRMSDKKPLENPQNSCNHPNKTNLVIDEALTSIPEPLRNIVSKLSQEFVSKSAIFAPVVADVLGQFSKSSPSQSGPSAFRDLGTCQGASGCQSDIKSEDSTGVPVILCGFTEAPKDYSSYKSVSKNNEQPESVPKFSGHADTGADTISQMPGISSINDLPFNSSHPTVKKKDDMIEDIHRHNEIPSAVINQLAMSLADQQQNFESYEKVVTSNCSPGLPGTDSHKANSNLPSFADFTVHLSSSSENGVPIGRCIDPSPPACERYRNSFKNNCGGPRAFHRGIQCNGCGMLPITGPRYKSIVNGDYDLCSTCFSEVDNGTDYMRIDHPKRRKPFNPVSFSSRGYGVRQYGGKLESRFIQDVTIPDGMFMLPSTPFRKIWRMHNNGSVPWSVGTQLVWIGGDQLIPNKSFGLEIPVEGIPVNEEIDIAVQFIAPMRPGRYISYWRMASPSGKKFGQRVWVLIQVDGFSRILGGKNPNIRLNLNLPPEISGWSELRTIDTSSEHPQEASLSLDVLSDTNDELIGSSVDESLGITETSNITHIVSDSFLEVIPEPVPVISDSIGAPARTSVSNAMCEVASECAIRFPLPSPAFVSSAIVPPHGMISLNDTVERDLLKELEDIGFKQVDLNKEVLRQNNYNLDHSLDFLCTIYDWKPLLDELNEMGFYDKRKNAELLIRYKGSITQVVLDLIAEERLD